MNEMVVPNKSTISEEVIEVPYARVEGAGNEEEEETFIRPQSSASEREKQEEFRKRS